MIEDIFFYFILLMIFVVGVHFPIQYLMKILRRREEIDIKKKIEKLKYFRGSISDIERIKEIDKKILDKEVENIGVYQTNHERYMSMWMGILERVMYILAWFLLYKEFIGAWLIIKVVGTWPNRDSGRIDRFLIGTGLSVLSALIASWIIIKKIILYNILIIIMTSFWQNILAVGFGAIIGFSGNYFLFIIKNKFEKKEQRKTNGQILEGLKKEIEEGISRYEEIANASKRGKCSRSRIFVSFWNSVNLELLKNIDDVKIIIPIFRIYHYFDLVNFHAERGRFEDAAAFAIEYENSPRDEFDILKKILIENNYNI